MINFLYNTWNIIIVFTTSLIISSGLVTIYPFPEGEIIHKEPVKIEVSKPIVKPIAVKPVISEKPSIIIEKPIQLVDNQKLLAECIKAAEDLNYQKGSIIMSQSGIPQESRLSLLADLQKILDRSKVECLKKFNK